MVLNQGSFGGVLRAGLLLWATAAVPLGCSGESSDDDGGADCASLCDRAKECPGAAEDDCSSTCDDLEEIVSDAGCSALLDDYFSCLALLDDLCGDVSDDCGNEVDALNACLIEDPPAGCSEGDSTANATCTSICERRAVECDDETVDCASACAESEGLAASTGCEAEYREYLGCLSTCDDLCSLSSDDCPAAFRAFMSCTSGS